MGRPRKDLSIRVAQAYDEWQERFYGRRANGRRAVKKSAVLNARKRYLKLRYAWDAERFLGAPLKPLPLPKRLVSMSPVAIRQRRHRRRVKALQALGLK